MLTYMLCDTMAPSTKSYIWAVEHTTLDNNHVLCMTYKTHCKQIPAALLLHTLWLTSCLKVSQQGPTLQ